ncbi:hypothetical protein B0H66DRAFT_616871 [Apodospora peruviana]|uniref:HMG box domain-containing protein n=1 Tax=Apodospora peruviana TaxID=516989 RepID=A0AAE0MBF6_9PEZI|nr:hypothetical protein B0H66DRAFT_616871 [Apodospora peruviana]
MNTSQTVTANSGHATGYNGNIITQVPVGNNPDTSHQVAQRAAHNYMELYGGQTSVLMDSNRQNYFIISRESAEFSDDDSDPNMENEDDDDHVPRPRNAFVLYRQWMTTKLMHGNPGLTASSVSQIVGSLWLAEGPKVKRHFQFLSRQEEGLHRLLYPEYRYEIPHVAREDHGDPMEIAEQLILSGL